MSFSAVKITALESLSPRGRKWCKWAFGLLLFYLVAGFLILPPIIRIVAVKQLSRQLDREVTIQKVKLNPLTLSVTIRGLLVKDKDADAFIAWDEVYVNFQIASLFGHSWIFKEISTTRPYARVQMNKDGTFNFSDLVTKFSSNAPANSGASKPVALRIDRLHIGGASATVLDLTRRTAFTRKVGPIDVNLTDFRTDPENKNPYSFSGTTDAGEKFSWNGYFSLGRCGRKASCPSKIFR